MIKELLTPVSSRIAVGIWNFVMELVGGLLTKTPGNFNSSSGVRSETWKFLINTVYPWMQSIGLLMLNLFIMIALCQAVTTLHTNITLELCVEALIKIVIVNVIFANLLKLMNVFFRISSLMCSGLQEQAGIDMKLDASDFSGSVSITSLLFGIVFVLVSLVCSFMILLAVYGRFLRLYLLVVMAPLAIAPLAGGQRTEQTFHAFVRTFLLYVFEIVVIQLVLITASKMMQEGFHLFNNDTVNTLFETVAGAGTINAMFIMILTAAMVKGANSFLSKAFGL